jgi:hypothetical protein
VAGVIVTRIYDDAIQYFEPGDLLLCTGSTTPGDLSRSLFYNSISSLVPDENYLKQHD